MSGEKGRTRIGVHIFWAVFILAAIARLAYLPAQKTGGPHPCVGKSVEGMGKVADDPERKENGQVVIIHVSKIGCESSIDADVALEEVTDMRIRMKTKLYPRLAYGNIINFSGKLSEPANFSGEGGRQFDYRGYLAKDDVFYEIKSGTAVILHPGAVSKSLSSMLFKLKRGFVSNLERALGEPHAALAAGLVVGEKNALGKDLLEDFRTVGLIHIVVLSGYNITIVADAMRKILILLPRAWGIIAGGTGIVMFGLLVGGGATVVRSCFMAGVALSADLIRRDYSVWRALLLAGLIMVIQNPKILAHDPSFQLSFLATLSLILFAEPFEKFLRYFPFIPEKFGIRGIIASSLSTQIFVAPYILFMIGKISVIGIVVNILVLPLIPVTMLAVFVTGALGFVSPLLSAVPGWISHLLLSYELFIVEKAALVPHAAISVPAFSGWFATSAYVFFAGIILLSKSFSQLRPN